MQEIHTWETPNATFPTTVPAPRAKGEKFNCDSISKPAPPKCENILLARDGGERQNIDPYCGRMSFNTVHRLQSTITIKYR